MPSALGMVPYNLEKKATITCHEEVSTGRVSALIEPNSNDFWKTDRLIEGKEYNAFVKINLVKLLPVSGIQFGSRDEPGKQLLPKNIAVYSSEIATNLNNRDLLDGFQLEIGAKQGNKPQWNINSKMFAFDKTKVVQSIIVTFNENEGVQIGFI